MTESGSTGNSGSAAAPPTAGGGPPERFSQDQPLTGAEGMIVCDRLVRIYSGDGIEVQALQGLDLQIVEGELTVFTSAVSRQHAISAGVRSIIPFQTRRAPPNWGHRVTAAPR
jgi:hypothetical protein